MRGIALTVGAGLIAAALVSEPATAQNFFYTVTCLKNETNFNINFSDKQNDSAWSPSNLAPGQVMTYKLRYGKANQKTAMKVLVKYDADGRRSSTFSRTIRLEGYASTGPTCGEGKNYAFRHEPRDKNFVMIQKVD
jgi:hypothetical protein